MKKNLLLLVYYILTLSFATAQTNVSGGIFTNTTWTLAGSPYIVVDTIVVFPGVTLTIDPGVTVKFANNKRIEIRQAKIVAEGTIADSITFTSNAASPYSGIYSGIYLNGGNLTSTFNYCNFYYADKGINHWLESDTVIVKNSNFRFNKYGIKDDWQLYSLLSQVDSSNFLYNTTGGLFIIGVVTNCNISFNGDGIEGGGGGLIKNCIVSNNQYLGASGSAVINCSILNNGTGAYAPSIIRNCIVNNNDTAIYWGQIVDSCVINNNNYGIIGGQNVANRIKNCTIDSNVVLSIAVNGIPQLDSILNCTIEHSGIGIEVNERSFISENTIKYCSTGILLNNSLSSISCNNICNNTTYGLQYTLASNTNVSNNNWCTPDSISTQPLIYDAHNNINLGIVYFMPIDSLCSPNIPTSINEIKQTHSFLIYPNPVSDYLTVINEAGTGAQISICNILGEKELSSIITSGKSGINVSTLPKGIHFIEVVTGNIISRQKFIKQ